MARRSDAGRPAPTLMEAILPLRSISIMVGIPEMRYFAKLRPSRETATG